MVQLSKMVAVPLTRCESVRKLADLPTLLFAAGLHPAELGAGEAAGLGAGEGLGAGAGAEVGAGAGAAGAAGAAGVAVGAGAGAGAGVGAALAVVTASSPPPQAVSEIADAAAKRLEIATRRLVLMLCTFKTIAALNGLTRALCLQWSLSQAKYYRWEP
jgi:hypothetical protein